MVPTLTVFSILCFFQTGMFKLTSKPYFQKDTKCILSRMNAKTFVSNKIQAAFYMDECLFHCLLGLLLFGQNKNMQCVLNWQYCEIAIKLILCGC